MVEEFAEIAGLVEVEETLELPIRTCEWFKRTRTDDRVGEGLVAALQVLACSRSG